MTDYEWTLETLDDAVGPDGERDIGDCDFAKPGELGRLLKDWRTANNRLGLVREFWPEHRHGLEKSWAYVGDGCEAGKLPKHFSDSLGRPVTKVPARFHSELAAAQAAQFRALNVNFNV